MKIMLSGKRGRAERSSQCVSAVANPALTSAEGFELAHSRLEPQLLTERNRAVDPYEQWLAARERAQAEPVRWVYRHPRVTRPAQVREVSVR